MITSGKYDFKNDGKDIIFTGKYMEVYLPQYYFDKKAAEIIGEHFKTLGILNFRTFQDIDGKKPNKIKVLNLPVQITTYPSGGFEEKDMDLVGNGTTEHYFVLKYYNGDTLCAASTAASKDSFILCLNITLAGKLPATIPYDGVFDVWQNSFDMNGVSFDIPDVVKELVIAQIYRNPSNLNETFGSVVGKKPNSDMYAYKQVNQRQLAASQSVFVGLIFENFDMMLTSGLLTTKEGRNQNPSPMEEIMKY